MLNIKIISIGDLKESYLREACQEYTKRIGGFARCEHIQLKEERLPENPSQAQIDACLLAEEKKIFEKLSSKSYVIAMCVEGKMLSSPELATKISQIATQGRSEIVFTIADYKLSISPLTFPHQLLRVILCEAIYRALNIINGTKYHK